MPALISSQSFSKFLVLGSPYALKNYWGPQRTSVYVGSICQHLPIFTSVEVKTQKLFKDWSIDFNNNKSVTC